MKVGFVGLGKLGLPCATAMAKEHDVMGYDINKDNMNKDPKSYQECGILKTSKFNDMLAESSIQFGSLEEVVNHAEIIFVAVQTPHHPDYEGVTPLPSIRVDFDYSYLKSAIEELAKVVKKEVPVVVISTVLPGTMRREILPLFNEHMKLVYNPYFIAMGTTVWDFYNPEFILIGSEEGKYVETLKDVYRPFMKEPYTSPYRKEEDFFKIMSVESAELTKVSYNTYISLKIAFVNILGEICTSIPGANVDEVTDALKTASKRITGPAYLSAGMGDAGGCHPRDNIAMSWLARNLGLSYDIFDAAMLARQQQAVMLGQNLIALSEKHKLPVSILGYAYKPNINLTVGSHALLVKDLIERHGVKVNLADPHIDENKIEEPAVVLVGINHSEFKDYKFPKGSLVIDPFRMIEDQEGVTIIRVGE